MQFLITTLQTYESEFYGAVARELERRGHAVTHVTESRASAHALREQGADARCLPDVAAGLGEPASLDAEVRRIETTYPIPHLRDVYRNDWPLAGRSEEHAVRRTVASFRASFTQAATPIREHRRVTVEARRAKLFAEHVRRKSTVDHDNDYLQPWRLLRQNASDWLRARAARPFYVRLEPPSRNRPFVYFPLHVTDDYKIQRVIPHCADQASLVEQV